MVIVLLLMMSKLTRYFDHHLLLAHGKYLIVSVLPGNRSCHPRAIVERYPVTENVKFAVLKFIHLNKNPSEKLTFLES